MTFHNKKSYPSNNTSTDPNIVKVEKIFQKFMQMIATKQFDDLYTTTKTDAGSLLSYFYKFVEEANKSVDKSCKLRNKDYEKLSELGIFSKSGELLPDKFMLINGQWYYVDNPEEKSRCLITMQQYDKLCEMVEKSLGISENIELHHIISAFKLFKSKPDLIKVIQNSNSLIDELEPKYIEIFATPLEKENIGSNTIYSLYRPRYISNAEKNKDFDDCEPLKRLEAFTLFNISPQNNYRDDYLMMLDYWGSVINPDKETAMIFKDDDTYRKGLMNIYDKVNYLFESLIAYGLIESDTYANQTAFRLLIYDVWYNRVRDYYNTISTEYIAIIQNKSADEILKQLSQYDVSDVTKAIVLAVKDYFAGILLPYCKLVFKYMEFIKEYDKNAAKKKYIDDLIKGNNVVKSYSIEDTDEISPYDFEELIARLFREMGYQAYATKKSGDQGVDIIASKGNYRIAIQAKCYPNSIVGNSAAL